MYCVKALMKEKPHIFLTASLFIPTLLGAYWLRMFERPLIPTSHMNFTNMSNCVWCVIITMATVGYGDYYPISNFGRVIGVFVCLWGVFVVSMSVATLNNLLEFSRGE